MDSQNPSTFDVVIAGAGPVGLLLACELRLAGISVLILESEHDPRSPLKRLPFGIRGLTVPTIEALHRRDLLQRVLAPLSDGSPTRSNPQPRRQAGHFSGIPFDYDRIDATRWPYRLPSPADRNIAVEMERIETALAAQAESLGADIRRGLGVKGFDQRTDRVVVYAGERHFEGRWLVGCDGGRSLVRKAGSFSFVGTEPEFTGYSAHVTIADPGKLKLGRQLTSSGMYFQTQPGHFGILDFDEGAFHRTQPITLEHVQAVLRRISQTDVTLTALHVATSWTDRAYQATEYRSGRVLLAGDAAHIHSPLGGQGLNLGLGDAMNLGWKLAAIIRGEAHNGLLDTYTTERHPVGAQVLDWSRAQVSLLRPGPASRAMGSIIRDLIDTRDGATYFAERVWNVMLRYDLGDDHPLTGRSVPEFELMDDTSIASLLRRGGGLLLDFDNHEPLRTLVVPFGERVRYIAANARNRLGLSAALVRPDGIVAWACDGKPNIADATQAVTRWFA